MVNRTGRTSRARGEAGRTLSTTTTGWTRTEILASSLERRKRYQEPIFQDAPTVLVLTR
jgi:hypothetical protein